MSASLEKFTLLIIDPQNDFHSGGSLAVPGADEDTQRLADLIKNNLHKIENIFVTLDSHNPDHIAHAVFWTKGDGSGAEPVPFQRITAAEVESGVWGPKDVTLKEHCISYAKALEAKGRFQLTIWPSHCIIGSDGQRVVDSLQEALDLWTETVNENVRTIYKGTNNLTEMYSAIKAEVPLAADPGTDTNLDFIYELRKANKLVIGGQALSHCVNYSTRDVLDNWTGRNAADLILLTDAASAVPGCQQDADKFISDMAAAGVTISTTATLFEPKKPVAPVDKFTLLIIDPQNDFHSGGSLAVPGADEDTERLANLIRNNLHKIENIFVTLDSHNPDHIAHAVFWTKGDGSGAEPVPFQRISAAEVESGVWGPKDVTLKDHCISYAKALESKGRFQLTIWPSHCIIGTHGQKVVDSLQEALDLWTETVNENVRTIYKGTNNLTEMYSAIKAEVPLAADPGTDTNLDFIFELRKANKLVIGGQALSHCVNYSTRDVLDNWTGRNAADLILLTDAASAVPGCQQDADKFISDMAAAGVTISTTATLFEPKKAVAPVDKFTLLIIDPQNDFHSGGSLAVPGADEDTERLANLIRNNLHKIENIFVTLDSHNPDHIAHAVFWTKGDGSGAEPVPFQRITAAEVESGVWGPKDVTLKEHCISYAKALESKGRFQLTIWPSHCIIGTHGQNVVDSLQEALDLWTETVNENVRSIYKGTNNLTEMYSAIKAEVPLAADPGTDTNLDFIFELRKATKLVIGGQALSHCVNYSTRDVLDNWTGRNAADLILLTDAASAVPGCQQDADKFISDMAAAGVTISTTATLFA